jgi:hypothetical protein
MKVMIKHKNNFMKNVCVQILSYRKKIANLLSIQKLGVILQ